MIEKTYDNVEMRILLRKENEMREKIENAYKDFKEWVTISNNLNSAIITLSNLDTKSDDFTDSLNKIKRSYAIASFNVKSKFKEMMMFLDDYIKEERDNLIFFNINISSTIITLYKNIASKLKDIKRDNPFASEIIDNVFNSIFLYNVRANAFRYNINEEVLIKEMQETYSSSKE